MRIDQYSDSERDDVCRPPESRTNFKPLSSNLLATCSTGSNKINITNLNSRAYDYFYGAQVRATSVLNRVSTWTHVKEISNTRFLVSINQTALKSASIQIFDVPHQGKTRKIYSLEETYGVMGMGPGDLTYNSRRNILGAISFKGKIAYHLFDIEHTKQKANYNVRLLRQTKWFSQIEVNSITGMDFSPNGELMALIDYYGVCIIPDVSTNEPRLHIEVGTLDERGCCKWSNTAEPLLFVKHDTARLNVLDAEKGALILKKRASIQDWSATALENRKDGINWIDVSPNNGNLVAAGTSKGDVKIYDRRQLRIIRAFNRIHSDAITCIRWNKDGDILATVSYDETAKLTNFKVGKIFSTLTYPEKSKVPGYSYIF